MSTLIQDVAIRAIKATEEKFGCHVASFVTDNVANMVQMRTDLENSNDFDIISYGCSAHYLNLLAKVVQISDVKEHVVRMNE